MLLVVAHLFALTACGGGQSETPETTVPQETEAHVHAFVDGTCQCGQTNGLEGVSVFAAEGVTPVVPASPVRSVWTRAWMPPMAITTKWSTALPAT